MGILKLDFKVPSHLSKMDGVRSEDGGRALLYSFSEDEDSYDGNGIFFRVCSWDESKEHKVFKSLMGKKCRLTLEVIDE